MEIGNFLGKLKGSEKTEPKKFLALILTDEVVQASVWHVLDQVTEIVAIGTPVEWDGDTGTTSELITAVDATISSATEGFADEPSEVILGIPHSWTDKDGGILGVKKEFINKIRKELELQALGYVEITSSILSYLKMQEGTPTTSIVIQVSRDELTLVLVRLGHVEGIETIGRSDDVINDVVEGIARFKVADNLPSRIILFNSMHNLDEIIQNLLSTDWPAEFNFLHIPKIEALPKDVAIRALSVAGGSEVAKSLGMSLLEIQQDHLATAANEVPADELDTSDSSSLDPEPAESALPTPAPELVSAEEIGFTSEEADFIEKDDSLEPVAESAAAVEEESEPLPTPASRFTMPSLTLPKISLPNLKLSQFSLPKSKPSLWLAALGLVLVAGLAFYLIWLMPQATVTVHVTPKMLDESVELTLSSTESSIDFAQRIVPAQIESVQSTGEKTIETTGKKTVGDPATGEVTIYNRTSSVKTFNKGTSLAAGSLKFTLDQDVQVASKSAGSDYVDVPGKANVKITASAIGADSNLAAGTEFTVASFGKDSYVAKNDSALAGGSSEEVQVVSKDDQTQIVKDLTDELLTTLSTNSTTGASSGTGLYLIPDSAEVETVTYSAKVGETAKSLTVNLTIKGSLLKYQTEDVTTLVNSSIDQAVPTGFVRADLPSTVELTASSVDEDGESVKGNAKVKVSLLPQVDKDSLQAALSGKKASALESILASRVPGFAKAEVLVRPRWIPTRLKSIPLNKGNITVELTPVL
jgi:hypothetical protein